MTTREEIDIVDTNIATHPFAETFPGATRSVRTYTTGDAPCPIILGFIGRVDVGWNPRRPGDPETLDLSVRVRLDARPLQARRKTTAQRVFFDFCLDISLLRDLKVAKVGFQRMEASATANGRYFGVPSGVTIWRRGSSAEYSTGLPGDVTQHTRNWAQGHLLPLLPPLLDAYAAYKTKEARNAEQEAQKERTQIENGAFDDWHTPERRARDVERYTGSAAGNHATASLVRTLMVDITRLGGTGMAPAEIAALAERAHAATKTLEATNAEMARKAAEATQRAQQRRQEMEAAALAKQRLENAAPALLEALEGLLRGIVPGGVSTALRDRAEAAIRRAREG